MTNFNTIHVLGAFMAGCALTWGGLSVNALFTNAPETVEVGIFSKPQQEALMTYKKALASSDDSLVTFSIKNARTKGISITAPIKKEDPEAKKS